MEYNDIDFLIQMNEIKSDILNRNCSPKPLKNIFKLWVTPNLLFLKIVQYKVWSDIGATIQK